MWLQLDWNRWKNVKEGGSDSLQPANTQEHNAIGGAMVLFQQISY